jgi:hypothetical protein
VRDADPRSPASSGGGREGLEKGGGLGEGVLELQGEGESTSGMHLGRREVMCGLDFVRANKMVQAGAYACLKGDSDKSQSGRKERL